MAVAACSPEPVTPRYPDVFGWVAESSQSSDYVFEEEADAIVAGTVTLTFRSGQTVVAGRDTGVTGLCQDLMSEEVHAKRCYLFVGLGDGDVAEWITAFLVDLGTVLTKGPFDHATDSQYVQADGTAIVFNPSTVEIACHPGDTLTDAQAWPLDLIHLILDKETGQAAKIVCVALE